MNTSPLPSLPLMPSVPPMESIAIYVIQLLGPSFAILVWQDLMGKRVQTPFSISFVPLLRSFRHLLTILMVNIDQILQGIFGC
jgi:hypothetical protein